MKLEDIILNKNSKVPIYEAPRYARWRGANQIWDNDNENTKETRNLFFNGHSVLGIDPTNKDINLVNKNDDYAIIDMLKWKSHYYSKVRRAYDANVIGACYRQKEVWAEPYLKRQHIKFVYPSKTFFDVLLKRYKCMITDNLQTDGGRDFWLNLIKKAVSRNLHVYYFNSDSMASPNDLVPVNDPDVPDQFRNHFWGYKKEHEKKHFIISEKKLN
jgi:hypothetical protein